MMQYKLLVLDDDPDIHSLLRLWLKEAPLELNFACTVEQAKTLLDQDKYDCMLLDIVLGNSNSSVDIINFLKSDKNISNKHIPVIVMSSHLDIDYGNHIRSKEPMILNVVQKPIDKMINLHQLIDDTIHAAIFLKG